MISTANTSKSISSKTQKRIDDHLSAAKHHEEAALHHRDAVKHMEIDNHDSAFESKMKANEHSWYAQECEMRDQERHALVNSYNSLISHLFI
jgi:hypothetical protein